MKSSIAADIPACFKPSSALVGISSNSIIFGYEDQGILAKCDHRTMERAYPQLRAVFARVNRERRDRIRIREELQQHCSSPNIVPQVRVVVHDGYQGEIAYTEVQKWYRNGRTLAEAGWYLRSAPISTLLDIRLIFSASQRHYKNTGDLYDTQGTLPRLNPFQKVLRAAIPLFSSTNILIDQDNQVRFIDATVLPSKNLPIRTRLHRRLKAMGERISILILDAAILVRWITKKLPFTTQE